MNDKDESMCREMSKIYLTTGRPKTKSPQLLGNLTFKEFDRRDNKYLKISDIEFFFGNCENNRVIDMIISATIKAIYQKKRTGKGMI